jgi:hypothetical protein
MTSEQTKNEKEESDSDTESEEDEVVKYVLSSTHLIPVSNQKMTTKKQRDGWTMR